MDKDAVIEEGFVRKAQGHWAAEGQRWGVPLWADQGVLQELWVSCLTIGILNISHPKYVLVDACLFSKHEIQITIMKPNLISQLISVKSFIFGSNYDKSL